MRTLIIAAITAWITASASAFAVPDRLTVVVFDYARTPHKLLHSVVKENRNVFHAAGIETDWILCSPVESCYVPDHFVQLKILAHAFKRTPISRDGMAETTTCTATDHCSASYIYYDRVAAFSSNTGVSPDVTLAYVTAHEIGHLLGLGHRPGGIMTAGFTARDLNNAAAGWLSFAADDARQLRTAVARTQLAGDPVRRIKLSPVRGDIAE
jgi:hypothetical protein